MPAIGAKLIVWIFAIQSLMVLASLASFYVNKTVSHSLYNNKKDFNWEQPLTNLVWLTSIVSIIVAFVASKFLLGDFTDATGAADPNLWWVLAGIISCGTLAGPLIMEFTKIFVSTKSRHVKEIVTCLRPGRRVAEHPVRLRHRQFLRVLDGAGDYRVDVRRLSAFANIPGTRGGAHA